MKRFFLAVSTIWQREVTRYGRDKTRIASTLIQPLMFLAVFGVGLKSTLTPERFGFDYVQFMYPGILAMGVMGTAFFSTVSTVWDREFGFLKEILVAPVPRSGIAVGKTIGAATIALIQASILLLLSPFLGLKLSLGQIPLMIVTVLLLSFAIAGMGLLIASLMRTTESFGLLMQVLIFPMFFLSGAFFPMTTVPSWMMVLARINPLTYGVDALRQILLNGRLSEAAINSIALLPIHIDLLFLLGFSAVMISAAVLAFNRRD